MGEGDDSLAMVMIKRITFRGSVIGGAAECL